MRAARVAAQAKVNLWLRVGPRDDATGYHEIDTLFHRIDLADDITIRVGGSVRALDVAGPRVPPGSGGLGPAERNLAYRAALAYAERAPWLHGFAIELTKNIPVGGGLGGGSADAGAVLRALDALAPKPLGDAVLANIGVSLGADVPFLTGSAVAAVGSGRGERLRAVDALPQKEMIVVVPGVAIATADAYRWLDESRSPAPGGGGGFEPTALSRFDWDSIARVSRNDFEDVADARHPELRHIRNRLRATGSRVARLAGSGSSVFGVFDGSLPPASDLGVEGAIVVTRSSAHVVQVKVAE
jgi:4-diphosphocytidyl-2-C-methyl-D-erythritol kinase